MTRFVASGSSDESESDPAGYKAYSAFTLEAGVRRQIGRRFTVEMNARAESREIDFMETGGVAVRMGSGELLPISLLIQYRLSTGALRPYVGVGGNLTVCWEKSGGLDSADLTPSVGPAVQLGLDAGRSSRAHFNVDLRWNPVRTDLKTGDVKVARLKLDALTLGLGVGFRF